MYPGIIAPFRLPSSFFGPLRISFPPVLLLSGISGFFMTLQIYATLADLKRDFVRVSVIGLSAELRVCRVLADQTTGMCCERWRGGVVAWWRGGVVAWWRGGVVTW